MAAKPAHQMAGFPNTVIVETLSPVKPRVTSNQRGTEAPSKRNMKGQDHQGEEDESVTVPEWKPNIEFCKSRIWRGELPMSISGM